MNISNQSSETLLNIVYNDNKLRDYLSMAQDTTDYEDRKMLCDACLGLLYHDYDFNILQEQTVINEFMAACE